MQIVIGFKAICITERVPMATKMAPRIYLLGWFGSLTRAASRAREAAQLAARSNGSLVENNITSRTQKRLTGSPLDNGRVARLSRATGWRCQRFRV